MNDERDPDSPPSHDSVIPRAQDELAELKHLLIGLERARIEEILRRLDDPALRAKEISRILPEAISYRSGGDGKLVSALVRTVEDSVRLSVERNPLTLVDSLFPVMGPAIRKSTGEFIRAMVQSLNQTLEHSFSFQGLKWRFESFRTGKPFAEVVLVHSLVFRVEQVFLIHRETGLLLAHVTEETVVFQDADMVSGMLTAIQDFVRDSFETSRFEGLEDLRIGELTVLVEHGPLAYLAAVVRGTPPVELRTLLKEHLEACHLDFGRALESFDGNAAPFQSAENLLQGCLKNRFKSPRKKPFPYVKVLAAMLVGALGFWAWLVVRDGLRWRAYLDRLRAEKGIVVVHSGKQGGKRMVVGLRDPLAADPMSFLIENGLDPSAVVGKWERFEAMDAEFVLARAQQALDPPDTARLSLERGTLIAKGEAPSQWAADARRLARMIPGVARYHDEDLTVSYETVLERIRKQLATPSAVMLDLTDGVLTARGVAPYAWILNARTLARFLPGVNEYRDDALGIDFDVALRRIRKELAAPETVSLKIEDGVLVASGKAGHHWILEARKTAGSFPEISGYRDAGVVDSDRESLQQLERAISVTALHFERNSTTMVGGQEHSLAGLVESMRALRQLAETLGLVFRIEVRGHTDSLGLERDNALISANRANAVASYLVSQGVPAASLHTEGVGSTNPVVREVSEKDRAMNRRVTFSVISGDRPAERDSR
ncbi:MAG: OmpA family protein [Thermodesulfobacteriota bacterium]